MRSQVITVVAVLALVSASSAFPQLVGRDGPLLLSSDPLVYSGSRSPLPAAESVYSGGAGGVWRGLRVVPEAECSEFFPGDYGVSDTERFIPYAFALGAVGGRDPLTCAHVSAGFLSPSRRSRLVTVEEAHRRGLCGRSATYRRYFVIDSGNVLPSPVPSRLLLARERLGDGWLPPVNQCWYVANRVRVHQRWGLTVPLEEARRFQAVLETCPASLRVAPVCSAVVPGSGR